MFSPVMSCCWLRFFTRHRPTRIAFSLGVGCGTPSPRDRAHFVSGCSVGSSPPSAGAPPLVWFWGFVFSPLSLPEPVSVPALSSLRRHLHVRLLSHMANPVFGFLKNPPSHCPRWLHGFTFPPAAHTGPAAATLPATPTAAAGPCGCARHPSPHPMTAAGTTAAP